MGMPAPKFATDPHRRALIAKVKIAQKELGLDEDTYRGVLLEVTGRLSAADCTDAQLGKLVEHFRQHGFKPKSARKPGMARLADHPSARKARAMWISLYNLGAIDNASEQALEAFARRQLDVAALQWANQTQCYKLIEALKAIAERHGWPQRADYVPAIHAHHALKYALVEAIVAKLKSTDLAHSGWSIAETAYRLCGIGDGVHGIFESSDLDQIARSLGAKLRAFAPASKGA